MKNTIITIDDKRYAVQYQKELNSVEVYKGIVQFLQPLHFIYTIADDKLCESSPENINIAIFEKIHSAIKKTEHGLS